MLTEADDSGGAALKRGCRHAAPMRRAYLWAIAANVGLLLVLLAFSRELDRGTPEAVRYAWAHGVPATLGLAAFVGAWLGVRASLRWLLLTALAMGALLTYAALVLLVPPAAGEAPLARLWPLLDALVFALVPLGYLLGGRMGGGRPTLLLALLMLAGAELARAFYLALTSSPTHAWGLAATLVLLLAYTTDTRRAGRALTPRATRR